MDEFEQAAYISSNPAQVTSAEQLVKASQYLARLYESPDGWRLCCEKLFTTSVIQAKFICFQIFVDVLNVRYSTFSAEEKGILRATLVKWLKEYIPQNPNEDMSIKNKFAQVFVLLFSNEYPEGWPTFFTELFEILHMGPVMVDMFLRIMETIDRIVVSTETVRSTGEIAHNTQTKDRMREDCIPTLVEVFYSVIVAYRAPIPALANAALAVLRPYIEWIDIQLIINERFMMLFYELLGDENLRLNVCDCLREVVKKGMDPIPKLDMLARVKILQVLTSVETTDVAFQRKLASLLDDTGYQLVEGWQQLLKLAKEGKVPPEMEETGRKMVEEGLAILWKYLGAPDNIASGNTLEFSCYYLRVLRSLPQLSETQLGHLQNVLKIATAKMKYPPTFNFDRPNDDEEVAFYQYRKEIGGLFKKVMKISPQLVAAFVHQALSTAVSNIHSLPFADVEVAVSLLYFLGDGISTLNADIKGAMTAFFAKIMPLVISSDLCAHPHKSVCLVAWDTIDRYMRNIPSDQPEVAKGMLTTVLTDRGIRHKEIQVRCRASYIFAQFVKQHKAHLTPFTLDVVNSLKDLLDINPQTENYLPFPYQVHLFDAVGSLINASAAEQTAHLEAVLGPIIAKLTEILDKQLYKNDTPENPIFTTLLANIITALVSFNKGFNRVPKNRVEIWQQVLDKVLKAAAAVDAPEIRQCVVGFLHRMVDSIGTEMFPFIPFALNILMTKRGIGETIELLRLVNQFTVKFKQDIAPVMNEVLMMIVERVHSIISVPTTRRSEEAREQEEVMKSYLGLMRNIIIQNLSVIFFSEKNQPHTETILHTFMLGLDSFDIAVQQLSVDTFVKLIDVWCGEGKGGWSGFKPFVYQKLMPNLFKLIFTPTFKPEDAAQFNLLGDVANVHYLLHARYGNEFTQFLASSLLPSIGCPTEITAHYILAIENPAKQLRPLLKEFILHRRKSG